MPYRFGPLRPPVAPRRSRRLGPALVALACAAGVATHHLHRGRAVPLAPAAVAVERADFRCLGVRLAAQCDGVASVLCGTVRVELPPTGEPAVGIERLDATIMSATRVPSGWVFATESGSVARSDTFTGRLHPLGTVDCDFRESPRSRGRAAVIDQAGTLWTTDGSRPVAPVTLPEKVHAAAFADPAHGAVALEHGDLLVTSDGGASWRRVDLGTDVATGVVLEGDDLIANTTAGARRVTPDGLRPFRIAAVVSEQLPYEGPLERVEAAARRATGAVPPSTRRPRCGPPSEPEPAPGPSADAPLDEVYACHVGGTWREPRSMLPEVPEGARVETTYAATSGLAEFAGWRTGDGELRVAAYWTGVDAAGRFVGRAGPRVTGLDLGPEPPSLDWRLDDVVVAEGITRGGVVFSSRALGDALLWAAPGRPVVALGRPSAEGLVGDVGDRSERIAAAQPDGAVALLYEEIGVSRVVGVALEVSASGAVVRSRAFAVVATGYEGARADLARWNGALGIVRRGDEGRGARRFYPLDGSAPVAFPVVTSRAREACAGAAAPDAITVWSREAPWLPSPATGHDITGENGGFGSVRQVEYEIVGGRQCLRSLVLLHGGQYDVRGTEGLPALMRPRLGRRFDGTLNDLGRRRVTCRPGAGILLSPPGPIGADVGEAE